MSTALAVVILTTWARSGFVSHVRVPVDKCEMLRKVQLRNQNIDKPWAIYRAECSGGNSKQEGNIS